MPIPCCMPAHFICLACMHVPVPAADTSAYSSSPPSPHQGGRQAMPALLPMGSRRTLAPQRASRSHTATKATKAYSSPLVVIDNYDSFTYNLCQVSRG